MSQNIRVGIVGATGYTGSELLRLLAQHPHAKVHTVTSRSEAGVHLADYFPALRGVYDLSFARPQEAPLHECDVVFFATPHGIAMQQAPELLEKGTKIIDLSADYRIKNIDIWEKWYHVKHQSPEWAAKAVYGLVEMNRDAIRNAQLVANPGCYPTAVTLPLLPLISSGCLKENTPIIANCISGVSGAGRNARIGNLLCEAGDNFKAYAVGGHRHLPEIQENIQNIQANCPHELIFVPHLAPMIRGMHATIYLHCQNNPRKPLEDFYAHHAFVDVLPEGIYPETRSVRASNICRIAIEKAPGNDNMWIVLSVIDNLVKGAAGQAIQNMNIMFDFNETSALNTPPLMP